MRGFLITGDDSFLEPYESALPRIKTDLGALQVAGVGQPAAGRPDRSHRLAAGRLEPVRARDDRRCAAAGATTSKSVRLGRGKRLTDDMRAEYAAFIDTEQALRFQRNNEANRTSMAIVAPVRALHAGHHRPAGLLRPAPAAAAVGKL